MARVLLFTGTGKGKTTAAVGSAVRALGHGMRVHILQFIKLDKSIGEYRFLEGLTDVTFLQCGRGFVPEPDAPEFPLHQRAAEEGLALAAEALWENDHDVYVLDEVCEAVRLRLLREEAVATLVKAAPPESVVILTGREAPAALLALADTATETRPLKHAHDAGRGAQKGVEW
ncbi:MAG: cob(I)yrinic acid a,c-diamide adenosyltransferase [Planctomycetota bacterium]